jgi:transcriptional regulator with XRE-family HTH domain
MDLGIKIKNLREIEKISQEQLAKTLKINRNYLSRIETGKSEPTSSILKDLANIFNISIDSLLDISNNETSNEEKFDIIYKRLKYLDSNDLDFLIRVTEVMTKEFVKKN